MRRFQEDTSNYGPVAVSTGRIPTAATKFAVLEERHRLAREIHDTLAQAFAGILLQLEAVPETVSAGAQFGSDSISRLACVKRLAKCGLEDSRRMLLGLRPKSLEGTCLAHALEELAERCSRDWRISCRFRHIGQEVVLSPDVQDEFFRIAQEALCNVHKHSRATAASILLSCKANTIGMTIKDNGLGFEEEHSRTAMKGFGLSSMKERARRIGGSLDILAAPRRGTEIRVRVHISGDASWG